MDNKKPVREYKGKNNSDIVNFPIKLRRDVFTPGKHKSLIEAPISTMRIIIKILNDISMDQFQVKNQPEQFSLFEKEFLTKDNTTARFVFKVKDIDKNLDYISVEKGLQFLANLDKRWHKSINSKGKTIKNYGGVILNPAISEGKVTFEMSANWISQFMNLGVYNPIYFQSAFELTKTKQFLFYIWLIEVKEPTTKIKLKTFNERYGYDCKTAAQAVKQILNGYRLNFDKMCNISFNPTAKGDLIYISPYPTNAENNKKISKKTSSKQAVTQKLHYWKNQHKLEKFHIATFRYYIKLDDGTFSLFLNSYNDMVKASKVKKKIMTEYVKGYPSI